MTRKNDKITKWYFVGIVMVLVSIGAFFAIRSEYKKNTSFSIADSLDRVVITVNDQELTMRDAVYYILVVESNTNEIAKKYNSDNPLAYWNIWVNHQFASVIARDTVIDLCVRDSIYYQEALKQGFSLTEVEKEEAYKQAENENKNLTAKQYELSRYTLDEMYSIILRIHLVKKYLSSLMETGLTEEQLDVNGEYYTEIKTKYTIIKDDDIWEQITLGRLSIN